MNDLLKTQPSHEVPQEWNTHGTTSRRQPGQDLLVFEDRRKGPSVRGLTEIQVANESECMRVLRTGARARHVASTEMNDRSSRSHTIFRIGIETRVPGDQGHHSKYSVLYLVDLAGSELLKHVGSDWSATSGARNDIKPDSSAAATRVGKEYDEAYPRAAVPQPYHLPHTPGTPTRKHVGGGGGESDAL